MDIPSSAAPSKLTFDATLAEKWPKWRRSFEFYLKATGKMKSKDEEMKIAALLTLMGGDSIDIYDSFPLPKDTLDQVLDHFDSYCVPNVNISVESLKFKRIRQKEGQTYESFLSELKTQAEACAFKCTSTDCNQSYSSRMIADQIVFGIRDKRVQQQLLRETDLTVTKASEICRAAEISVIHSNELSRKRNCIANAPSTSKDGEGSSEIFPEVNSTCKKARRGYYNAYTDPRSVPCVRFSSMPVEESHCSLMETGDPAAEEPSPACMLTEDALVTIFKLLPFRDRLQARKVCRAWQTAIDRTWSSTKKLDLFKTGTWSSDDSKPTESLISEVIERCGRFLVDVQFGEFAGVLGDDSKKYPPKNQIIPSLVKHCSYLTGLAVSPVCQPEDVDLKDLYLKNQGLKSLSVFKCGTGESLLSLPQCLERLVIQQIPFSDKSFCPVITRLVNLKHLKISRSGSAPPDEIECLQSLKHLESYALIVRMTRFRRPPSPYYLSNVPKYANLRSLTLHRQPSCTDEYLKSVAEHCHMLETVSLGYSDYVSDSGLSSLLNLGSVKHLSIEDLPNVTANSLTSARNLVELNCVGCFRIDVNGLYTFITSSETLSAFDISNCCTLTEEWKMKFEQLRPGCVRSRLRLRYAHFLGN